jgi:hypothetical protein
MYPRPSCNDLLGLPVPRGGPIVRDITHKILIFLNNFKRQLTANRHGTFPNVWRQGLHNTEPSDYHCVHKYPATSITCAH